MIPSWVIPVVLLVIMIGVFVALYFLGRRMEKQQAEQREQIEAASQQVTLLIIDKKRLKLKDAGMPEAVIAASPWYTKNAKVPVVKVKAGPRIMNLICAEEIFDELPTKKEVKATVSGLYLTSVRGLRGKLQTEPVKKGWRAKLAGWLKKQQDK